MSNNCSAFTKAWGTVQSGIILLLIQTYMLPAQPNTSLPHPKIKCENTVFKYRQVLQLTISE